MSGPFDALLNSKETGNKTPTDMGIEMSLSEDPAFAIHGRLISTGLVETIDKFVMEEMKNGAKLSDAEDALISVVSAILVKHIACMKLPAPLPSLMACSLCSRFSVSVAAKAKAARLI